MEVINKKHKDILHNVRVELACYMKVDTRNLYFSAGCNFELGIISGLFMHFVNDGDRWLFYLNDDQDGFAISAKKGKSSCSVNNASLCALFLKRTKCSLGNKFPIVISEQKIKDCPLYEILINKVF